MTGIADKINTFIEKEHVGCVKGINLYSEEIAVAIGESVAHPAPKRQHSLKVSSNMSRT